MNFVIRTDSAPVSLECLRDGEYTLKYFGRNRFLYGEFDWDNKQNQSQEEYFECLHKDHGFDRLCRESIDYFTYLTQLVEVTNRKTGERVGLCTYDWTPLSYEPFNMFGDKIDIKIEGGKLRSHDPSTPNDFHLNKPVAFKVYPRLVKVNNRWIEGESQPTDLSE